MLPKYRDRRRKKKERDLPVKEFFPYRPIHANWGRELKRYRKAIGFSQEELAEKIGVTSRTISFWETGKRGMLMEHAETAFGVLGFEFVLERRM